MSRAEGYAEHLASDLVEAARKVVSGRVTIKRHLRTILNESGWSKRSSQNVAKIANALADAGVSPDVDVTDLGIALGSWVHLSDKPFPARSMSRVMVTEKALNQFISDHHDSVFTMIDELQGLEFLKSEKQIKYRGGKKRVDVVFKDEDGTLVGVELERGDPKENSAFQLRGYLDALAAGGEKVRGILITARPKSAYLEESVLIELAEIEYPTSWYWYDTSITLQRLDA